MTEERLAPVTYLPGFRPLPVVTAPADELDGCEAVERELANGLSDEIARARDAGLRMLGRRDLSLREIERRLETQGFSPDAAGTAAVGLEAEGYIDDHALAQELVGRLQERKGLGRGAIAGELATRLLKPAAISYALDLVDGSAELARATELAVKRAAQLAGSDRETAVRRLSGYLTRRGYSGTTVRAAVEHALAPAPRAV